MPRPPCSIFWIFWKTFSPQKNSKMSANHPGGGGLLPYKRLMGMCRWMGSHFHDWIDNNGVAFSIELLQWGRTFSDFWSEKNGLS